MIRTAVRTLAAVSVAAALTACSSTHTQADANAPQTVDQRRAQAQRDFDKAQELTVAGQYEDAINLYKEAVTLDPKHMLAWYYLGVLCNHQNRYAEAVEAWRVAADIDTSDPRAYFALGLQYQELGILADAAACYNRALERDPSHLPSLKKSVEVDQLRDIYTDVTLDRIRKALLRETDPKWGDYLRLMQIKAEERVARAGGNTGH
jgi:tetratricopeptide (TPR) repeat protein